MTQVHGVGLQLQALLIPSHLGTAGLKAKTTPLHSPHCTQAQCHYTTANVNSSSYKTAGW